MPPTSRTSRARATRAVATNDTADPGRTPTVVVPRGGAWGAEVADAARDRGLEPLVLPLIATLPPVDPAPLDRAVVRLVASGAAAAVADVGPAGRLGSPAADRPGPDAAGYAWLVVTSATSVRVLAERTTSLPAGIRVAAVGRRTAAAAHRAGWPVDLVPGDASAADLVAALPDIDGSVLVPRSDIAAPTLVDGLRARGIDVDDVVAYRTVGTGDDPVRLDPAPDAVLVTSGSVAREVARRMTPLDPRTRIACIGPGTADEARAAGLPVHVVGRTRSAVDLLDAVVQDRTERDAAQTHPPRTGRPS